MEQWCYNDFWIRIIGNLLGTTWKEYADQMILKSGSVNGESILTLAYHPKDFNYPEEPKKRESQMSDSRRFWYDGD